MSTQRQPDMKFDLTYPSDQTKIVQRLGEKTSTDILVQVFNKGVPYNLAGMTLGFELRTDNNKIIIDKEQSRFTIVEPLKGVFSYRMHPNAQSFEGNAYIAYFTFEQGGSRITTERFRVLNDEDVQNVCAPNIQQHYVSVIDDLVASNKSAMAEAQAIRDMINANQVVRKTGDTMSGNLNLDFLGTGTRKIAFTQGGVEQVNINRTGAGYYGMYDVAGSQSVWEYNQTSKTFNVNAPNTNIVTKSKDGRATLTLTSDATNTDAGYPPIVTRRGNSATLRMAISRNAGSSSSLVTTLPVDMRPIDNLTHAVIADDSTVIKMVIQSNGEVRVFTSGKLFNFVATYVVD
ncbi:BppU family phage baseplate upper protein [Bacillus cereus]|uniref:BppU family phage baseplate upper protein n=1 Tax=Bacillus cereus TaxID=1396 RepID=UPI0018F6043D|nr:BppU family phage baseplate upper protein [Bacillus cereus]MBJ8023697.1 BppU family phage baseplate upper protein [Bacillus cereus]